MNSLWTPTSWQAPVRWIALLATSTLITLLWSAMGLPAALLLGPLIGGIIFGTKGVELVIPRWPYLGAQAVIGAMVSTAITPAIFATLGHHSLLFGLISVTSLLGAAAIGWLVSLSGLIPGATAVYGISPGAATAMVVLGEAEGADPRLVAFMQYSRVLLVALAAAIGARFWASAPTVHATSAPWLVPVDWGNLAALLVLATVAQQLARLLHLQAWAVLGPILLLSALHAGGWLTIELPRWLLSTAYALLGWHIGLGIQQNALRDARHALPTVLGASFGLMAFCGVLAWLLARAAHIDVLTAYLATSPGGLDSVAIIAAATPQVDLSFVIAMQSMRLVFVIGMAPSIARLVVRYSRHLQRTEEP